jgi:hypothetical protein
VIDLEVLWARTYRELIDRAAHDIKGAMNGLAVNLEVLRSRIDAAKTDRQSLHPFAEAAHQEFEAVMARTGAHLYLARIPSDHADVAVTLKHMAMLLVPTAKSEGVRLVVEGYDREAATGAPHTAVRLALAAGLLALIKEGGGSCTLETKPETVVRFSHESAAAVSLDPEVTSALAQHGIKARRSPQDLHILFP